jgi:hypothetical protein
MPDSKWQEQDELDAANVQHVAPARKKNTILNIIRTHPKTIDTIIYIIFLIMFTAIVFNTQGTPGDATPYLMSSNVRAKWGRDFMTMRDAASWFDYMEKTFMPLTFPSEVCMCVCVHVIMCVWTVA